MARRLAVVLALLLGTLTGPLHAASTPAGRCAAAKLKAANKKTAAKLKCNQKAFAKGRAVDGGCLARAELRFQAAFAKAEVNGGCPTIGDAERVEGMVDTFVTDLANALSPTPGSTTTTTTTVHVPTSATTGSSTSTVTTASVPTSATGGSSTTAAPGSSTSATTASSTSATTASSTTATSTTTTVTVLPCGGIAPACSGTCPMGLTCTGLALSPCACQ